MMLGRDGWGYATYIAPGKVDFGAPGDRGALDCPGAGEGSRGCDFDTVAGREAEVGAIVTTDHWVVLDGGRR